MTERSSLSTQPESVAVLNRDRPGILQRQCHSCGRHTIASGECTDCAKKKHGLQRQLTIGSTNDPLEQAADRVADQVMAASYSSAAGSPFPQVQRYTGARSVGAGTAPASVDRVLERSGRSLDPSLQQNMEQRFGYDFSQVRVHTDLAAEQSAQDVNANAYTVGHNIVFGAGQFSPSTKIGQRLIAHELAHVVQQNRGLLGGESFVQRDPKSAPKGTAPKKAAPKSTAADAPKLDFTPSKNGSPCACLLVVHNDEQNARKTASLMHEKCSYNLTLLNPNKGSRKIKIPKHKDSLDPNSLFPRETAEKCTNNMQGCRDFLTNNAGSTDKDEIEEYVKTQFFVTVSDCSKGFSLPVVALHNNDIEDTKNYLKQKDKDKVDVSDLKLDVDKSKKETGEDQVTKLKDLLTKKFSGSIETELMETAGKTNIFRWCASTDLSHCHIGDPEHPDNVTWVTNEKDFAALKKQPLNVALQSEVPKSKKSESVGDLSTLFLLLKDIYAAKDLAFIIKLINVLRLQFSPEAWVPKVWILVKLLEQRRENLRYINIESPGKGLSAQTDAERIRNYEAIVEVLKATGLHCCGTEPQKAEASIKEELKETKEKKDK